MMRTIVLTLEGGLEIRLRSELGKDKAKQQNMGVGMISGSLRVGCGRWGAS